ncbi:LCP family protein [Actinomadura keratinilytica]|uniref:LCP family protein n=1 Tax=Actinomadura keratinilytica TaxID=547461 RepID=UPI0031F1B863
MRSRSRRARGRLRRVLVRLGVAAAVLAVSAVGLAVWRADSYDRRIQRLPEALPSRAAPPAAAEAGQNWLLLGSDLRGVPARDKWRPGGRARADTIMVLHLPPDERHAYVISIPRDLWTDIPGHPRAKINAAFAHGGPRLMAQTVQQLAGIRLDHVVAVDFAGFARMTDALGGVDIYLDAPIHDPSNGWSWPAGRNHLDGARALRFVRERKGLSGSDLDRVRRQHAFLRAMAAKAVDGGTLRNPVKLDAFLRAASESVAVDDRTGLGTLRSLALRLARIGPDRVTFATLPTGPSAWIGGQNVLLPDPRRGRELFAALAAGRLREHVRRNGLATEIDLSRPS